MTETGYPADVEMYICYRVGRVNQQAKLHENFKPIKMQLVRLILASTENTEVFKLNEENIEDLVLYFWNWYEWP